MEGELKIKLSDYEKMKGEIESLQAENDRLSDGLWVGLRSVGYSSLFIPDKIIADKESGITLMKETIENQESIIADKEKEIKRLKGFWLYRLLRI